MIWQWQTQVRQDIIWTLNLHLTIRKFQSFHFPSPCQTDKLSHQPIQDYSPNRTYGLKHGKHIFFWVFTKPCCQLELFCDHGFQAVFDDKEVLILDKRNGKMMMKGRRDTFSNLYMLDLNQHNSLMIDFRTPDECFAGNLY